VDTSGMIRCNNSQTPLSGQPRASQPHNVQLGAMLRTTLGNT